MAHNNSIHPAAELRQSSQRLREQATFTHRQAANGAARARRIGADLAELDLEQIFRQLREMVELLGGKPRTHTGNVTILPLERQAQAAE